MLKLGRLPCSNKGFDLLTSLGKCNILFIKNNFIIQLAFLVISSTPSLKNIAQLSNHSFRRINFFSHVYVNLPYGPIGMDQCLKSPSHTHTHICLCVCVCVSNGAWINLLQMQSTHELYKCDFHALILVGVMWWLFSLDILFLMLYGKVCYTMWMQNVINSNLPFWVQ